MFSVAALRLAFHHFGTRETPGSAGLIRVEFKRSNYVTRAETLPVQEKLH